MRLSVAGGARREPTRPLLEVENLVKHFPVGGGMFSARSGVVRAVDGVSFTIRRGETLGLVGESGCGKTTTGRCILQLERPTSGRSCSRASTSRRSTRRAAPGARRVQVIFQDPYSSSQSAHDGRPDPRRAAQGPRHRPRRRRARQARVQELLGRSGCSAARAALPARALGRPAPARRHRARARHGALAHHLRRAGVGARRLDPGADHQPARGPAGRLRPDLPLHRPRPVGGAPHLRPRGGDVPRQDRRDRRPQALYEEPLHPYTQALLSAVPIPDPEVEARASASCCGGEVPSPLNPPPGCVFHPRCPIAVDRCRAEVPALREIGAAPLGGLPSRLTALSPRLTRVGSNVAR